MRQITEYSPFANEDTEAHGALREFFKDPKVVAGSV